MFSAGDALFFEGGVLQLSSLLAADGEAYGIAQGPLVLGGFFCRAEVRLVGKIIQQQAEYQWEL